MTKIHYPKAITPSVLRTAIADAVVCGYVARLDPGALPCHRWERRHALWVMEHLVNTPQTVSGFASERKLNSRTVSARLRAEISSITMVRRYKEEAS